MSIFNNTPDDIAKNLLGKRFEDYSWLKDHLGAENLYEDAKRNFSKVYDNIFLYDIGETRFSAYKPNIATIYLLSKGSIYEPHNNSSKPDNMLISLANEYLDIFKFIGITTFNPTLKLNEEDTSKALATILYPALDKFETQWFSHSIITDSETILNSDDVSRRAALLYLRSFIGYEGKRDFKEWNDNELIRISLAHIGIDESFNLSLNSVIDSEQLFKSFIDKTIDNTITNASKFLLDTKTKSRDYFESGFNISSLRDLTLGFTILPGQIMLIKGEDPRLIKEVMMKRCMHILSYSGAPLLEVNKESTAIANMIFLPFPELWKSMDIDPESYFGYDIGNIKEINRENGLGRSIYEYGFSACNTTNMEDQNLLKAVVDNLFHSDTDLSLINIFLKPRSVLDEFSTTDLSDTQLLSLVNNCIESKRYAFSDILNYNEYERRLDIDVVSKMAIKLACSENLSELACSGTKLNPTKLILEIKNERPEAITNAFRMIADMKNQSDIFRVLIKYGNPPDDIFDKLTIESQGYRLENDLGL